MDSHVSQDRSDLERATEVVRDFMQKAAESGALAPLVQGRSKYDGRAYDERSLTDSYGKNGMIHTMCSDASADDSDFDISGGKRDFDTDFDVDFLAFPDFEKKAQDEQNRNDAALL
ncbi:unnamed protein product [Laminaria digitata]